ncbi:hypothetical protein HRbin27_00163 [bacterium HR27]|nr:hypothetical protein HRbin27_00163 [bacterium HR27]
MTDRLAAVWGDCVATVIQIDPQLAKVTVETLAAYVEVLDPDLALVLRLLEAYDYFRSAGYPDARLFLLPLLAPPAVRRELAATCAALFQSDRVFYGDDAEQLRALEQAIEAVA